MFDTCLPHLKTLAKGYKAVDGKPAFTKISSTALKARADAEKLRTKICVCVLIFDEIALHLQAEIGRKKTTLGIHTWGPEWMPLHFH